MSIWRLGNQCLRIGMGGVVGMGTFAVPHAGITYWTHDRATSRIDFLGLTFALYCLKGGEQSHTSNSFTPRVPSFIPNQT